MPDFFLFLSCQQCILKQFHNGGAWMLSCAGCLYITLMENILDYMSKIGCSNWCFAKAKLFLSFGTPGVFLNIKLIIITDSHLCRKQSKNTTSLLCINFMLYNEGKKVDTYLTEISQMKNFASAGTRNQDLPTQSESKTWFIIN